MPRLPQPGSDQGTWGEILNEFLSESHNADGTLNTTAIQAVQQGLLSSSDAASTYLPLAQKGIVDGVASLDDSGKVPSSQLPANDVTSVAGKTGAVSLGAADIIKSATGPRLIGGGSGASTPFSEIAYTPTVITNSIVSRDGNGRSQFADPSTAQDAATKNYVDTSLTSKQAIPTVSPNAPGATFTIDNSSLDHYLQLSPTTNLTISLNTSGWSTTQRRVIELEVIMGATPYNLTWDAAIKWMGNAPAPSAPSANMRLSVSLQWTGSIVFGYFGGYTSV